MSVYEDKTDLYFFGALSSLFYTIVNFVSFLFFLSHLSGFFLKRRFIADSRKRNYTQELDSCLSILIPGQSPFVSGC